MIASTPEATKLLIWSSCLATSFCASSTCSVDAVERLGVVLHAVPEHGQEVVVELRHRHADGLRGRALSHQGRERRAREQSLHDLVFLHCGCPAHPCLAGIPRFARGRPARPSKMERMRRLLLPAELYSISLRAGQAAFMRPARSAGCPSTCHALADRRRRVGERLHLLGERLERDEPVVAAGEERAHLLDVAEPVARRSPAPGARRACRRRRAPGPSTPEMCTSPVSAGKDRRFAGQVVMEGVVDQPEDALPADRLDRRDRLRLQPQRAGLEPERLDEAGQPARCRGSASALSSAGSSRSGRLPSLRGHQHQRLGAAGLGVVGERRPPRSAAARASR